MSFHLYSRENRHGQTWYTQPKGVSIFGKNNGYIPRLLRLVVPSGQEEPYKWHIPVRQTLGKANYPDASLVFSVKPKKKEPVLNLFELIGVWGYSNDGWTPAMVELREILRVEDVGEVKRQEFLIDQESAKIPVYSFWYFGNSTVSNGQFKGKWNPPAQSSTNSVILWPEAMQYFVSHIRRGPLYHRGSSLYHRFFQH